MSTYLNPEAFTDLTKTKLVQGDHEIWYKSSDDEIINPSTESFGNARIVSNKKIPLKDIWVIEFDSPVYCIPEGAFANSNLLDIWIPDCCTDIESNAFGHTSSLYNVDINCGYSIDIYGDAFARSAIKYLTLKSDNVTIYSNAFAESSLESITFTSLNPPDVSYEAFNHTENLKIYVPTIAYDAYLQAFNGAGITNVTVTAYATKEDLQSVPHADFATDLSGRVEATPEVFTYRPSAGDKSIKDDNAFIRRVKGNSVVWNQLIRNAIDQSGDNGWWARQGDATVEIVDTGIKFNFISGVSSIPMISQKALTKGHTYYISIEWETSDNVTMYVRATNDMYGGGASNILYFSGSAEGFDYCLFTPQSDQPYICIMPTGLNNDMGHYAFIKAIRVTDISRETYTAAEFRELYPNSYYPYNAGELRNLNCYGIKTVGFNQWDGNAIVGYIDDVTGEYANNTNYKCTDYIEIIDTEQYYATITNSAEWGAWYDENKTFISGQTGYGILTPPAGAKYLRCTIWNANKPIDYATFCINLHHTGYRDGEYEPYKEVTHVLPLSKITNGEPLRKAGSVYDEINETEYIRRVGVVDLGSLNWYLSDSDKSLFATLFPYAGAGDNTVATNILCSKYVTLAYNSVYTESIGISVNFYSGNTYLAVCDKSFNDAASIKASLSGVLLHYELAEPIVTPIETPIDFNYYVEDFGTEEALLAENSAPFSADIIYQFNAVDRIRQNSINVDRLEEKVSSLPSEFKTINGNSIVGSGDLTITAGNVGTEDDSEGVDDVNTQTYLRYVEQSLTDDQKTQARTNIGAASISDLASKQDSSTLATVATSGSYNDLTNKPTIPSAVTESTVSGWGFTKNAGTVTGVKANGTTKNPSNGVVDLGTIITEHQDISGKQDQLVSGTNIKTINGTSIIGSGNLSISGGSNINVVYAESGTILMQHNTMTIWSPSNENTTVTLTFPIDDVDGQACYNCGLLLTLEGDCSLELDGVEVYWANETAPDMAVDKTYEMWFTSYDGANRWFGVFTKY